MKKNITVIPGDGIGPEIVTEAKKVLDTVCEKYGHEFAYTEILMGGCSIDACGVPLTEEALATAKASDAVLLGAVGGVVAVKTDGTVPKRCVFEVMKEINRAVAPEHVEIGDIIISDVAQTGVNVIATANKK